MSKVFVLDTNKQAVNPVHAGRARILLTSGKAAVFKSYPFTIILKRALDERTVESLRLKIDPGSKTTGLAILNDASGEVVFAAELAHRGQEIKKSLERRYRVRRSRRRRHTRYRKPRFDNRRTRCAFWIAPSLESRVCNVITWVKRLMRLCPISAISQELVKFDLQRLDNLDIGEMEYQQGTLQGYEVRQYLLEKWNRQCTYCGAKNVPLQVEHICPRVRNGSSRISNLTLACSACNRKKGTQDIRTFLANKPDLLTRLLAQAKAPLSDAAAVNTTRWVLYQRLKAMGVPVECGSGGRTQYNRTRQNLPKSHWLDAACGGESTPALLKVQGIVPLLISADGHGRRQMCLMDNHGFPRTRPKHAKHVKGFQTGDIVRAMVPFGTKRGTYVGRVAVRATGSFNITTKQAMIQGISHSCCTALHKCDGYSYGQGNPPTPAPKKERLLPPHA